MIEVLDEILLSDNVVKNFYKNYGNENFKKWVLSVLPEIEECKNQNQDNPWHVFNCLDHILHSVEEINKQTIGLDFNVRRMLAYIMLLHDIGKPKSYIRRYSKLYGREVDSFFNHNIASVKIAERVLKDFKFNRVDACIIKELIDKHDIFMFITMTDDGNKFHKLLTESYLNEIISDLDKVYDGKTLIRYLIMVGRADNMAQNPKITKESLIMLNVMEDMVHNIIKGKTNEK